MLEKFGQGWRIFSLLERDQEGVNIELMFNHECVVLLASHFHFRKVTGSCLFRHFVNNLLPFSISNRHLNYFDVAVDKHILDLKVLICDIFTK
jgi:hypothetical protein